MILYRWFLFVFLMICVSCTNSKPKFPILDNEEKIVEILVDMYIAEATLNRQPVNMRDSLRILYRDNIILIHDLSEVEFDSLFLYIQTNTEIYQDIHKQVVDSLNALNTVEKKD